MLCLRSPALVVVALATALQFGSAAARAQDGGPADADAGPAPADDDTITPPDAPFNFRLKLPEGAFLPSEDAPATVAPPEFSPVIDDGEAANDADAGVTGGEDPAPPPSEDPAPVDVDTKTRSVPFDPARAPPPPSNQADAPPLPGEPTIERPLDPRRCVSAEQMQRAIEGSKREAFGTSSIPLGPFFWATRDRTLVQAMLVYWRYLDVKERSRLEFLFPFYLKSCTPQSDTFVGSFGLWGHRTDALGTAGYIGPYLYRRDAFEQSDVVFPVYWWLRGERDETFVAGPWYSLTRGQKKRFGLVPVYFGGRDDRGGFFDVTPVFAQWGDAYERNFWALQTWGHTTPNAWSVASFPFYWGGVARGGAERGGGARGGIERGDGTRDDEGGLGVGGSYYHLIPPLLTFFWGEETREGPVSRTIIGAYADFVSPGGHDAALFPLAIWGEGEALDATGTVRPTFGRSLWDTIDSTVPFRLKPRADASFSYQLAPFFLHLADEVKRDGEVDRQERWAVGPAYLSTTTFRGWDAGVVPFWFEGWESERAASERGLDLSQPDVERLHYRVIPPLLYAHFANGDKRTTYFAQTYLFRQQQRYDFGSIPFYFRGRDPVDDDRWYDFAPLALNFHWGHGNVRNHIIGPGFSTSDQRGFDHGVFPFYFGGETTPGHQREGALFRFEDFLFDNHREPPVVDPDAAVRGIPTDHYRVVPPLLYAHFGDAEGNESTFAAQTYLLRDKDGWDFGSVPFVFLGRDADDDEGFYDVIPPLFFARWGDRHQTQLIAGPWYDFRLDSLFGADVRSRHFGVFPFLFAGRFAEALDESDLEGQPLSNAERGVDARYHFGPFYLHLGFDEFDILLAAQTLALWDEQSWFALSLPVYVGYHEDARLLDDGSGYTYGARSTHVIPPLLTYISGYDGDRLPSGELDPSALEGPWSTWITGSFWYVETQRGFDTSLLPLFAFGVVDDGPEGFAPTFDQAPRERPFFSDFTTTLVRELLGNDARDALFGPRERGFSYHLIPPLAYGHLATATHRRTVFLQSYLSRSDAGYDIGSVPFFFHGRGLGQESDGLYYDVIPPLLFASWGNDAEHRLLIGQTYWASEHFGERTLDDGSIAAAADAWRLWSIPFAFFGADDRAEAENFYAVIPPLGFAHFGDATSTNTIVGPYFDLESTTGRDFGFAPFYLGGEGTGVGSPVSAWAKDNLVGVLFGDDTAEKLLPPSGHHYRVIPPLAYAHLGDGDEALTLFGSAYLRRSPSGWDGGVFPLVFAGATSDNSVEDFGYAFAPLLLSGFVQAENNRTTIVGPWFDLHFDIGDDDEFRALGLLPLAGGVWSRDGHLFAGPGFAHWGDAASDHFWAVQTFGSDERILDASYTLSAARPPSVGVNVDPLVFRSRLYSVPFFFYEEVRGEWPDVDEKGQVLYEAGDRVADGEVLSRTLFMPPLLTWAQSDQQSAHLVAGPWFDFENQHGRDFGLVPFYFEGASAGTGRSPLWRWARTLREDLWGFDEDALEVAPGVYAEAPEEEVARGDSHYRVIPALAYMHFGDADMHRTIFGPSWFFDDADGWNVGILPLYFGRRSDRYGDHDIIPPLLFARWREAKRDAGGLVAGPFVTWDAPTYTEAMLLGLFYGGWMTPDDGGRVEEGPLTGFVRSLPLGSVFAGERGDDGSWWVAPPFGAHRAHQDGSATFVLQSYWIEERDETHLGSVPFFFHGRSRASGDFYDVIPPLLFGIWGDKEETNIFAGQTWATFSPSRWRVWSAPFYFGGVREQEWAEAGEGRRPVAYHHLVPLLGTFFWGDDVAGEERALIAPFLTLWLNNPADSFLWVGPYTRFDDKATGDFDQALWPLWFSGQKGESFYNVVLPVAGAWGDAAQQTRFVLTAFETTKANGDYTRAILPFYYSHKRFKQGVLSSSFDMITPAYFAWGDRQAERRFFAPTLTYSSTVGDEDFLIAPFVYHLENQAETNTIVFPFYWHFRRAEAGVEIFDATVASGLWWDFQWPNEGKRLQIAPGYVRFEEPDEELHIAGPISWTNGKGAQSQAWSFHVFPFFSMWSYHPGHFKWRALLFAAGYEVEERDGKAPKEQWMFFGLKTDAE